MLDRIFLKVAEELPEGNILSFDMQLIINAAIRWVNIMILIAILVYVLYNPVKKFMADRTERIRNDIDSGRAQREEGRAYKEEYQKKMDDIEKEREAILSEAYRVAVKRSDQLLEDAKDEAEYLKSKAHEDIKAERDNAADEIKRQIIEISTLIASRFVEDAIDSKIQDKYIDEALADWSEQG